jgi:multidrug efflux pump subunit AcrA (membrane-fusion protein)
MRPAFRSSSALILAARVLLLAIAAGAVAVGFVVASRDDDAVGYVALSYVCPMHPEVRASSPDAECPICHMALQPLKPSPNAPSTDGDSDRPAFPLAPGTELRSVRDVTRAQVRVSALEMRAPAWLESPEMGVALLYRDESALLEPNEDGLFTPAGGPSRRSPAGIEVRLTGEPPVQRDGSTSLVRFHVPAGAAAAPDQTGWLKLRERIRKDLVIPYSAVVQSPTGPYVLVVAADKRTLTKRPIEIGRVLFGYASVISGVNDRDSIAVMNTFFLDAERRLGQGSGSTVDVTR